MSLLSKTGLLVLLEYLAWATWILLEDRCVSSCSLLTGRTSKVILVETALDSWSAPAQVFRNCSALLAVINAIGVYLAVGLVESQLLLVVEATAGEFILHARLVAEALRSVAVPILSWMLLLLAAQLLVLMVHLHDLHYWLLHFNVILADWEAAWFSLVSPHNSIMVWDSQRVLTLLNLISVEGRNIVVLILLEELVVLLLIWWHLIHVQVSSVKESIGVSVWSLLITQAGACLLVWAEELLLLLSDLTVRVLLLLARLLLTKDVYAFGLELPLCLFELILSLLKLSCCSEQVLEVGVLADVSQ
jgi:hypothetical protein